MKRKHLIFLTSAATLLLTTSVYADKNLCPSDSVHCAYVTGLSDNLNNGRYIKLTNATTNITLCFNNYGLVFMDQQGAAGHKGKNADQYSICSDGKGKNCKPFTLDSFVVNQKGNEYSADPVYFNIDLSKVKNDYPPCELSTKPVIKVT